nr:T9SS type A sorting domain-containing protein [Flavobacterium sp. Sd200]
MVLNPSNRSCDITFTAENEISTTALNHNNCAQLSAKNFAENNFSLYPNPAKGSVNLLPQGNNVIATVKISDLTGKTIYTLKNTAKGALTINTTGFASGTYFIEITGSNSITTIKKLLVE